MARGRKKAEVKLLNVQKPVIEHVKAIYPPEQAEAEAEADAKELTAIVAKAEADKSLEDVLSIMPWEKINLKSLSREELLSLFPRFGMDKDKAPSLTAALQNALSLEEKVTMQAFTLSQRERMELKKQETIQALDKEITPIISTKADDFVALFKEFGFTADGKEKKSFSLSKNYGHRVGKEHYKIAFSVALTKEDVPLTEAELLELQYQASCSAQEAEWEKMRLLMVGQTVKDSQKPVTPAPIENIIPDNNKATIVKAVNTAKAEVVSAA